MNTAALIENLIAASTPGGIEAQERRGQSALRKAGRLPMEGTSTPKDRANFESLGFVFGEPVDDLFVSVTLPAGWEIQSTSHALHSNLVDNQGRKRGMVSYKAAFYDRWAQCHLSRRYSATVQPVGGWTISTSNMPYEGVVQDQEEIIYRTDPTMVQPSYHEKEAYKKFYTEKDEAGEAAKRWLTASFPDWQSVLAYWD